MQGYLSINFLPNAVYEPVTCMELTLQAAQRYSFPSERPAFETAESEQVRDETHLTRIFQGCRERGFLIAVDDVGAGYACLKLPADFQPDLIAPWRARVGILMERSMSPFLPR
ncbi:EAL domain-containing protein [Xanthomonas tesorieronis]|uniref:EAL domain-containing protein n=1 Tax=Xanthomonas tesorieronis TaxID=3160839 RepID=UPI0035192C49